MKVKIVTRGTSYKFNLLKQYIIGSSWEIGNKYFLENPFLIKLVASETRHRGILQFAISNLGYRKFQRYNRFKISLLKERKRMTQIKKIETPNKKNWMDDLNYAIEAKNK